jgi:Spy/CpxP family protein refolding chaperone
MKNSLMTITIAAAVAFLAGWATNPLLAKPTETVSTDCSLADCLRAHFQKRLFAVIHPTADQQDKLIAIFDNAKATNDPIRAQIKAKAMKLMDAFADESTTDDKFKEDVNEVNNLRRQLMDNRLDATIKARAVLSSDQRKTLSEKIKSRLQGWLAQS